MSESLIFKTVCMEIIEFGPKLIYATYIQHVAFFAVVLKSDAYDDGA